MAAGCQPNPAHYAIAALQRRLESEGRRFTLITQNVDRLAQAAGSTDVLELHGRQGWGATDALRCTMWHGRDRSRSWEEALRLRAHLACSIWDVCRAGKRGRKASRCWEDRRQPLVPSLAGRGAPDGDPSAAADLPLDQLPHDDEGRLLRPGVVWFNEQLDAAVLAAAEAATAACDLFITAGTSAVVYPAAGFAHRAKRLGAAVAEFNLDTTGATGICDFAFQGRAGELLPAAFGVEEEVQEALRQPLQKQGQC